MANYSVLLRENILEAAHDIVVVIVSLLLVVTSGIEFNSFTDLVVL